MFCRIVRGFSSLDAHIPSECLLKAPWMRGRCSVIRFLLQVCNVLFITNKGQKGDRCWMHNRASSAQPGSPALLYGAHLPQSGDLISINKFASKPTLQVPALPIYCISPHAFCPTIQTLAAFPSLLLQSPCEDTSRLIAPCHDRSMPPVHCFLGARK